MTDVFLLAFLPIAVLAGYTVCALTRPSTQRRFTIMAEAISVVDTDTIGIVFRGVDKQGIKTGPILSTLNLNSDNTAVTISGPDTTGLYTVTLVPQTTPIDGPVVANVTATDPATGASDTTTLTFNAGPAVSISATLSDIPPAA